MSFTKVVLYTDGDGRARWREETMALSEGTPQARLSPLFASGGYQLRESPVGFRTGWEGRRRYENRRFDEVERELAREYQRNRGDSRLEWAKNRHAARAAWERFDGPDFFERSQ